MYSTKTCRKYVIKKSEGFQSYYHKRNNLRMFGVGETDVSNELFGKYFKDFYCYKMGIQSLYIELLLHCWKL